MTSYPDLIRNVAVVGHLHHGKTAFVDSLVRQTHAAKWDQDASYDRYSDVHELERDRGISIKSMPMSLILPDLKGKSYLINLLDTPGKRRISFKWVGEIEGIMDDSLTHWNHY